MSKKNRKLIKEMNKFDYITSYDQFKIDHIAQMEKLFSRFFNNTIIIEPKPEPPKELTFDDIVKVTLKLDKETRSHNWKKDTYWVNKK